MKTRVVYTLVSDASDLYLEQLMVSVYSLRLHNNSVNIAIVIDKYTDRGLKEYREHIRQMVDEIIVVDTPYPDNKMLSSRYLKTNLRNLIDGTFLFIDCDTIICENLDKIDSFKGDIGMVSDLNAPNELKDVNVIAKCERAGFKGMEGKPYYNSGVIFVKDTLTAHQLYTKWYKLWRKSANNGVFNDQPALCAANIHQDYPIQELSSKWNCQFKFYGSSFLNEAKILHYYSNTEYARPTYSQQCIFEHVREKGYVDDAVRNIIQYPRTVFYAAVNIRSDKAFEFFYSEMLHYFYNVPPVYRFALQLARVIEKPILILSKLK